MRFGRPCGGSSSASNVCRARVDHLVLDQTPAQHLFRVGATYEPTLRRDTTLAELEDPEDDWDVEIEILDPENP